MKNNSITLIISFFLGLFISFSFYPISIPPFIILIGILPIILKKVKSNTMLFTHGLLFGYAFFIMHTYWIPYSIYKAEVGLNSIIPLLSLISPIPYSILMGIFFIMTQTTSQIVKYNKTIYLIHFALLWVIFEYIRSEIFFPFSWGLISYSSICVPYIKHLMSYVGSYGTSLFIVFFSSSIFSKRKILVFVSIILFLTVCIIGYIRRNYRTFDLSSTQDVATKIRIIQPNIQDFHFGNTEKQFLVFKKLHDLTLSSGFNSSKYVFWPEAAFPYPILTESRWIKVLKNFVPYNKENDAALIFGIDRVENVNNLIASFNSMLVINRKGEILGQYDKNILVPFGEYMPFHNNYVMKKIAYSLGVYDIRKGNSKHIMNINTNTSFLPLICSESTVNKSHLSLTPYNRYKFILNISNDAWFEKTLGPYQHFIISKIRAIEYGLPIIRVANSGISGVIDSYGKTIKMTKSNKEAVIDILLPKKLKYSTLFYTIGDYIIIFVVIAYITIVLLTCSSITKYRNK